jgi:hypothetical protein
MAMLLNAVVLLSAFWILKLEQKWFRGFVVSPSLVKFFSLNFSSKIWLHINGPGRLGNYHKQIGATDG